MTPALTTPQTFDVLDSMGLSVVWGLDISTGSYKGFPYEHFGACMQGLSQLLSKYLKMQRRNLSQSPQHLGSSPHLKLLLRLG